MRKSVLTAALTAAVLAAPAAAQAHVTLQPKTATAGAYTRLDVRVPNERDDASTMKVELQMPPGFASASYEPVPGWKTTVTKSKLDQPIKTDDGEITEGVDRITWTADSEQDAIPPGAFRDFGLSVQIPGKAGDTLTFKALQTYSGGEVVRWIGAEGTDNPAPTVSVTAEATDDAAAAPASTPAPAAAAASDDDGGSGNGLAIVALIVGALGLAAGGVALFSARRRSAAAA
ncbi:MAG TPA: YcnI family protein [Solirubrobacter sp.]|nr:YcnI family protein [Solirubrobacter sp.]